MDYGASLICAEHGVLLSDVTNGMRLLSGCHGRIRLRLTLGLRLRLGGGAFGSVLGCG